MRHHDRRRRSGTVARNRVSEAAASTSCPRSVAVRRESIPRHGASARGLLPQRIATADSRGKRSQSHVPLRRPIVALATRSTSLREGAQSARREGRVTRASPGSAPSPRRHVRLCSRPKTRRRRGSLARGRSSRVCLPSFWRPARDTRPPGRRPARRVSNAGGGAAPAASPPGSPRAPLASRAEPAARPRPSSGAAVDRGTRIEATSPCRRALPVRGIPRCDAFSCSRGSRRRRARRARDAANAKRAASRAGFRAAWWCRPRFLPAAAGRWARPTPKKMSTPRRLRSTSSGRLARTGFPRARITLPVVRRHVRRRRSCCRR